ncbi:MULTISPECIES: hypothetical protein [unclassified Pseudoalteromonas]|uniref:hypothetical protein n=1 Tax=unclassified Pseudoalteromonas TaxID=194690 RepID=UPI002359A068|nr:MULTISPECIES: hypothetical protein [unclassified Pseudoalteromonas]MDC9558414.1 hypothetical protein [Pseudoalteromonas sp. CST9]MDC9562319.1 hypothetical protein [Pseudoalteromonas sp. CST6]
MIHKEMDINELMELVYMLQQRVDELWEAFIKNVIEGKGSEYELECIYACLRLGEKIGFRPSPVI